MRSKWVRLAAVLLAVIALIVFLLGRAMESNRLERNLDLARQAIRDGDPGKAALLLSEIEAKRPDWGEVPYRIGICEQLRGRTAAAMVAWARVPADSEFAALAAASRGRVLINSGRFAAAESLLEEALPRAGKDAAEVRRELELLYQFEGRTSDVRRLILDSWPEAVDPAATLKKLYIFEVTPYPVDAVRIILNRADPNDDRVQLGKANLATRTGRFQEAESLLDRCDARRPGDRALARSRLELGLATGDVGRVREAAARLPAEEMSAVEALRVRAWLATRSGDKVVEQGALETLLKSDAGNVGAMDRLAELAHEAGRSDEAAGLRRRKTDVNDATEAYRRLLDHPEPVAKASEFVRLAERMGRPLEARGWSLVPSTAAKRTEGGGGRAPLEVAEVAEGRVGGTLADVLGIARSIDRGSTSRPTEAVGSRSPSFLDDAEDIGLKFVHDSGNPPGRTVPPAFMCGGVALFDYNGDGRLDVYAVQAGPFPPSARAESSTPGSTRGDRLFRNRGDGRFEDVSDQAGITRFTRGYGHGVTVADFDNDGHPDLFVTRRRAYALYRNRGDGTFEDVTAAAGLSGDRDWPTSAAFADLDGDGDLDLYVCHYLKYDEDDPRLCKRPGVSGGHECNPRDFPSLPDHLFRNDGGRFTDVSREAGITDTDGRGMGVVAAHLDDDDKIDFFVANDSSANYLFRNLGGFRFEEVGQESGVAANSSGTYQAGMGASCGDLDGDGRADLVVTNFYNESTSFFRNLGRGFFAERGTSVNLTVPTRQLLGFGIVFLDADNDGRLDVLSANGHIHDGRPQYPYAMPAQLLLQDDRGRLFDASSQAGPPFRFPRLGRGLAAGDLDDDGRVDAVMLAQNEPLVAFRNRTEGGRSITLRLEGTTSNRDAVGAVVEVSAGGRKIVAQRTSGGSYQSSSDPRLHFGLGQAAQADRIEIRWPSGKRDRFENLKADQGYLLKEGAAVAVPLTPGGRRPS